MKTVILGIGNTLKGDDGVGPYIISQLSAISYPLSAILIDAGTIPENYIQKIIDLKLDKIIIIDAIDFRGKPGEIKYLSSIDSQNISISTHNLPPSFFIDFIKQQTSAEIEIIAIQPKEIKFNTALSEEIKKSADKLISQLCTKYTQ